MSSTKHQLGYCDSNDMKSKASEDFDTSLHSEQSKQTTATAAESSIATNTTSKFSQVDSWALNSLVPDCNGTKMNFNDSFVNDIGNNPWWENLESPAKASRQPMKSSASRSKKNSSLAKPPTSTRSSSPKQPRKRDCAPRSPKRHVSHSTGEESDHQKSKERKDSRNKRPTSKSPLKSRDDRPSYRRCRSHTSINELPSIDLTGVQTKATSRQGFHRDSRSTDHSPTRCNSPITRGVSRRTSKVRPSETEKRCNPKTRRSSTERRESPIKRHDNTARKRHESPSRKRSETRTESKSRPRKTRSSPVKESKPKVKLSSSRKTQSSSAPPNVKTEQDVLDFIAAQIKSLEATTDVAIDFTVSRRSSLDAAQTRNTRRTASSQGSKNRRSSLAANLNHR